MKIVSRALCAAAVAAALLAAPAPAPAAPLSNLYTNFRSVLADLATAETDAEERAALEKAAALFDNTSKSFAADLIDGRNAIKHLEKAYGTADAEMTLLLDGHVGQANLAVLARAIQAYTLAQQRELGRGNLGAVTRLAKLQVAKLKAYGRAFPETPDPEKPVSRVKRMSALIALEKYAAGLGKRYRLELNGF